jgi:hypothetical protein
MGAIALPQLYPAELDANVTIYIRQESLKKRCFLHLGLHKTASSSAQATFTKSQQTLRDYNIEFPIFKYSQPGSETRNISNHSIPILSAFSDNPSEYHINKRWGVTDLDGTNASYLRQLREAANSGLDLLLSGEGISILSATGLRRFTSLLEELGFEIHAFALVRSPYSFACSSTQEVIRGGVHIEWLDESIASNASNTTYVAQARSGILASLREHFGDSLKLFSFSAAKSHPHGPVGYIVESMKICHPEDLTYVRNNESMGNKWIRAKNLSNGYFKGETLVMHNAAQGLRPNTVFSNDSKFLLTESEFKRIEQGLKSEINAMQRLMGDAFSQEEHAFAEPLSTQDWRMIYLETLASR